MDERTEYIDRRGYLAVVGAATVSLVTAAGCLGGGHGDESGKEPSTGIGETDHDTAGNASVDDTIDGGDSTEEDQASKRLRFDVVMATGEVSGDDHIDRVNMDVRKDAGSPPVDLSSMTIEYVTDDVAATLTHGGEADDGAGVTADTFTTTSVAGNGAHDKLVDTDDRVRITFDTALIGGDDGLEPRSSATVKLFSESAYPYTYGISTPSVFGDNDVVYI